MSIRVLAHFVARPERIDDLAVLLTGLVAPTRAEVGCRHYTLWRHREAPERFTMVEAWDSDEALAAHFETPHLRHAVAALDALLAAPLKLDKYTEATPD